MSDQPEHANVNEKYAFVRVFHPRASLQVSVPIPIAAGLSIDDASRLLASVDNLLMAGWLTMAPGLEAGEEKEDIGYVCRLDHETDGKTTPTVLLYSVNDQLTYSFLRRYMNTPEDVAAFEYASGMKYDSLPPYPGNDHPQRGVSPKTDRFIIKAPKPFGMVWKHNPRYKDAPAGQDTRSLAEKRKRDFFRWSTQIPAAHAESKPAAHDKNWNESTEEERLAKIEVMEWEPLAKCRDFCLKMPIDKGKVYLDRVKKRAFELFKYSAGDAPDEAAVKDIEDAAYKDKLYGEPTVEQRRDLDAVIKMTRTSFGRAKR